MSTLMLDDGLFWNRSEGDDRWTVITPPGFEDRRVEWDSTKLMFVLDDGSEWPSMMDVFYAVAAVC